jgi:hypothetical protein
MDFFAQEYAKALGRTITYQDIPVEPWRGCSSAACRPPGAPPRDGYLHRAGRYERMSEDVLTITGQAPMPTFDCDERARQSFTRSDQSSFVCNTSLPSSGLAAMGQENFKRTRRTERATANRSGQAIRQLLIGQIFPACGAPCCHRWPPSSDEEMWRANLAIRGARWG